MNSGRITAIASALLAVLSLVLAWVNYEGIMVVISFFALMFGLVASKRCSAKMNSFIMVAAFLCLVSTFLSTTVLSPTHFMEGEEPSVLWFIVTGLLHAVPLVPLVFAAFVIIASVTGASYNWAIIRGLSPFIGMGMEVPGFVLEYMFQGSDQWMTDNGYILYHFLMTFIVMFISSRFASSVLRKNSIVVTLHGLRRLDL